MERRIVAEIASGFFLASVLFAIFIVLGTVCYLQKYGSNSMHSVQHAILAYGVHFVFAVASRNSQKQFYHNRHVTINRSTKNNAKIVIFQGRGAVRNLAIFHILVAAGPLSMGDIQRKLNKISGLEVTYYASLNKRIHALVRGGYIGEVKPALGQVAGFRVCLYGVRAKFYLAYYLNGKSREEILSMLNEPNAIIILSELINADDTET